MTASNGPEELAKPLRDAVMALSPGDFDAATRLLSHPVWETLEAHYWNASHPLPGVSRQALDTYLHLAKTIWHRAGLGQSQPIALYKTTLLSAGAIRTALRILGRMYAGSNLGYRAPPKGFWRTVYAITGYIVSERFTDRESRPALLDQSLQLWLMAWLNPLSLAPGRLPIAVRLVGILSKACSYTLSSPTHAGSGLAAADLLSDTAPMPFARIPAVWEPAAPLYINAQDAAFTIRELATPSTRRAPNDVYDSLLQSALQVGLTSQEMQDFIRRAMREFGYSNVRSIPRVGRRDPINVVAGFIDCWGALQSQSKSAGNGPPFKRHAATVINHSDGGFLLKLELAEPALCVGSLLCLRGNDMEPWTVAAIRWLEDSGDAMLVGCEFLCNFAEAHIAQTELGRGHNPVITFEKQDMTHVLCPFGQNEALGVSQIYVDGACWVLATASEIGEDWQLRATLDITPAPGSDGARAPIAL
ncbi:MAG: hypothetical protein LC098_03370 [Burkholderiales bacterium]|nr:hypothetical protein [Burkholderiales bacterium]